MKIEASIHIPSPGLGCVPSVDALIAHIRAEGRVKFEVGGVVVMVQQSEPDITKIGNVWLKVNSDGAPVNLYGYDTKRAEWVTCSGAHKGERRTILRTESTVAQDREMKGLRHGWELADGKGTSGVDLRDKDKDVTVTIGNDSTTIKVPDVRGFFEGQSANWTTYTVIYTGL